MIKTADTGAPITAELTAAIDAIAKTFETSPTPNMTANWPANAPADTPTNNAGENTPPKRPKPIQSEVINIFATNTVIRRPMVNWPAIMSFMLSIPNPKIWGTQMPTNPQTVAAMNGAAMGEILSFGGKLAPNLNECMNNIATAAKIGARTTKTGTSSASSGTEKETSKPETLGNQLVPKALAVTDATAMGAIRPAVAAADRRLPADAAR